MQIDGTVDYQKRYYGGGLLLLTYSQVTAAAPVPDVGL